MSIVYTQENIWWPVSKEVGVMGKIRNVLLIIFLSVGSAHAAVQPPAEGGVLPDMELSVPTNPENQQYLGLSGKDTFRIPEIKADVVIVEIFSMY